MILRGTQEFVSFVIWRFHPTKILETGSLSVVSPALPRLQLSNFGILLRMIQIPFFFYVFVTIRDDGFIDRKLTELWNN